MSVQMNREENSFAGKLLVTLLVMAVIVLLIMILLPSFLPARKAVNERAVVKSLRNLVTAQKQFQLLNKKVNAKGQSEYGTLKELDNHKMIDPSLAKGRKYGYQFTLTIKDHKTFTIRATPITFNDGNHRFYVDQSGVVTYAYSGVPDASSDRVK